LEIRVTLIAIQHYIEAKLDYGYFIFPCVVVPRFYTKKIQVILTKNEGVRLIFPIQNVIKIQENCRNAFIFGGNDLRPLV